ncbi:MAG TPA: DNA translocase FtsK 4TM domain-containing protein, partial [Gemmataceae bacterium]|nr:DNA translocase FtsK 4TM domain-containing protein [Gemmataceae bacterium]
MEAKSRKRVAKASPEPKGGWLHLSRFDVAAILVLIAGLLISLAVLGQDFAPGHVTSLSSNSNLLGSPGAWVATRLHRTLGISAYLLLVCWFVAVVMLFQRRQLAKWCGRLLGWLMLVPCLAYGAELLPNTFLFGSSRDAGGILGAWLTNVFDPQLSRAIRHVIVSSAALTGLLLAVDFLLIPLARLKFWGLKTLLLRGFMLTSVMASKTKTRFVAWIKTRRTEREDKRLVVSTFSRRAERNPESIPIHHHEEGSKSGRFGRQANEAAEADPSEEDRFADYELPSLSLLEDPVPFPYEAHEQRLRETAALLEKVFLDFSLNVKVVGINTGPVITQYEIALETGLRVHKVTGLADDLALNLKVPSVRIVAPIPGKNTVGVEVPNEIRATVRLKEVVLASGFKPSGKGNGASKYKIPLFLGKDSEGRPLVQDLADMPHLLIAGRTGTGKSVCMNAIILSILMTRRPDEVKMVMIDPKMLELSEYGKVPHLMHPVVKDMKKAEAILSWAVDKMEERYDLLSRARVRSIAGYNELSIAEIFRRVEPDEEERRRIPEKMPYIVIFVDEMNDLMMTMKKEVEGHIIRLAQKSRAAGIHLVVATQKPTVDVITGLIKSNLPARICFQVSSRSDSRVVLDEMGADKLLGKGDMLYLQPGTSTLVRSQGTYLNDEEIHRVVEELECEPHFAEELVQLSNG